MAIWPSSAVSRPERQLSSVVLPQPDGPIMATISPRRTLKSTRAMPSRSPCGMVNLLYPRGLNN